MLWFSYRLVVYQTSDIMDIQAVSQESQIRLFKPQLKRLNLPTSLLSRAVCQHSWLPVHITFLNRANSITQFIY